MSGSGIERVLPEIGRFLLPIRRASQGGDQLSHFLSRFGYQLDPGVVDAAVADLGQLAASLTTFGAEFEDLNGSLRAADLLQLVGPAKAVFTELADLGSAGAAIGSLGIGSEFFGEVFDALTHDYLVHKSPLWISVFEALGVLEYSELPAATSGRQLDASIVVFRWSRLGTFLSDTGRWADEVYGWGRDFDVGKAITAMVRIVERIGMFGYAREMTAAEVELFLEGAAVGSTSNLIAHAPILDRSEQSENGAITVEAEAGIVLAPFGDPGAPDRLGFAIAPYTKGNATGRFSIVPDELELLVQVDSGAVGGKMLGIRPGGLSVVGSGSASAQFELALKRSNADGSATILVGDEGATRVQISAALLSVGGDTSGDFFVAAALEDLEFVIDVSEDGLLASVIPGPIEFHAGDVLIGWRAGRGVYFEGGTSLGISIPLDIDLWALHLSKLELALDWEDNLSVVTVVDASLTIGPLFAQVEGLGVETTVVPDDNGLLGRYDLDFAFVAPNGYAVDLDAGPLSGGGSLSVEGHEYRGALSLQFETLGLSAFAILTTKLPGGQDGFSFVASIFASFSVPLGYGFFLTGVGGIIGLNRTIDTEAMREVLYAGRLDNLIFPSDPIANASTILDDMADIFPAKRGQHVFGPVAKIGWGQPILVEGKLGVIIEIGANYRILILGALESILPDKNAALVELRFQFFGEIDFAKKTISLDATLEGSRVLTYSVSGDIAARTGWAPRIGHAISFGGLHPAYPPPSNLPELRRLGINFGGNNPRITMQGYQAVTLNSLQYGASASLYAKGPKIWLVGRLAAEGNVYFDALVYFNPFAFDVSLGGSLSLLVDGDEVLGLGFRLRLRGPNTFRINGKVWAKVFGKKVKFGVNHTWGSKKSIATATVDPAKVLEEALRNSDGLEAIAPTTRSSGVTFAELATDDPGGVDPMGGLRFVQRAVPLRVDIEKVGEARVSGSARNFDIAVTNAGNAELRASHLEFVRGHYWNLSESERLRSAVFEEHKAGVEIVGDGALSVDAQNEVKAKYDYDIVVIEAADQPQSTTRVLSGKPLSAAFIDRWSESTLPARALPNVRWEPRADDAPVVAPTRYSPAATVAGVSNDAPIELAQAHLQSVGAHASYVFEAMKN